MGFHQLLQQVKDAGEDREWYPTTEEQIQAIHTHLLSKRPGRFSLLDIGAGNGKVLDRLRALGQAHEAEVNQVGHHDPIAVPHTCYAIEQSRVLIEAMPSEVFVIGTDFWQQSLIDKKVEITFCNPPYSDFANWATKIIRESASKALYLILPARWKDNPAIQAAITARRAAVELVGAFDYADAEDRKARAKVEVLFVSLIGKCGDDYYTLDRINRPQVDPFDLWFDAHYQGFASAETVFERSVDEQHAGVKARVDQALVAGGDLIQALESLYQHDLDQLVSNYQHLSALDPALLKELGVEIRSVKKGMRLKIEGLKDRYWHEMFENMGKITSRLTSGSRKSMLEKLTDHTHMDFTADNAYAVLIWVLKKANLYFDSQLVSVYSQLVNEANVSLYKSNDRLYRKEDWRYLRQSHRDPADKPSHYKLETRVVLHRHSAIDHGYHSVNGLAASAADFINDLLTLANNLTFPCPERAQDYQWERGKTVAFHYVKHQKRERLMEVKAFDNGNLHIKFASDFMAALNVEHGRLMGWVRSAQEAAEEMSIAPETAQHYFAANLALGADSLTHLLPAPARAA